MEEELYVACCAFCGSSEGLMMFAHRRDEGGHMIGWLFVCSECAPQVAQMKVRIVIEAGES